MANKINVKLILELKASGLSQNLIAKTRHISKTSISDVLSIAHEKKIFYDAIKDKSEDEVYRLFYPDKFSAESTFKAPDYPYIHNELKKVGVTLKLLHQEYKDSCFKEGVIAVGYTKFTEDYRTYTKQCNLSNHLYHKPGQTVEVDWSGSGMEIVDALTGEVIKVHLFVACLPYSQYAYVEPTLDEKQDTWLRCHIHMYQFFEGVPVKTVCDNLKTGVIKHPKEGEIILNDAYEGLGSHYITAIMPTGVRKPKQKASVEGTVGKIATAIIAKLRHKTFYSFAQLKESVAEALNAFNEAPFQKRQYNRKEVFQEEKQHLRALPDIPYEVATWEYHHKVYPNSHACISKNYYSVPFAYAGQYVDVKLTESIVEIYNNHQRISSHPKFPLYVSNHYATHKEDMPDAFNQPEMNDLRLKQWAASIGTHTSEVIERLFKSVTIKEQAYNSALSVLKLSKTYSNERLENACEIALPMTRMPRYKHLKGILASNQDVLYAEEKQSSIHSESSKETAGYVRGADYYGGIITHGK
ncbi:MAG: IS21 family transposase [Cellulosilyticaceae bacterium]